MVIVFGGILLAGNAKAQIQQGNVIVGVNLANVTMGLKTPKYFSLTLNPSAAWFVNDKLAFGGSANFGIATSSGTTITNYGAGLLARYYAGSAADAEHQGRFFAEANIGITGYNHNIGGSSSGFTYDFGPGYVYFITRNVGLEASLRYYGVSGFSGPGPTQSNIGLVFGFQIYLAGKNATSLGKQ